MWASMRHIHITPAIRLFIRSNLCSLTKKQNNDIYITGPSCWESTGARYLMFSQIVHPCSLVDPFLPTELN